MKIIAIFFILVHFQLAENSNINYSLERLQRNPGIFFEEFLPLRFSEQHIRILVFIDFKSFFVNLSFYRFLIDNITCPVEGQHCIHIHNTIKDIETILTKTGRNFREMHSIYNDTFKQISEKSKSKFVDTLLDKKLDEEDIIYEPQDKIHIIKSNIGSFESQIKENYESLTELSRKLTNITKIFGKSQKESDRLQYKIATENMFQNIDKSLQFFDGIYETIIDIILTLKYKMFHSILLTENQLAILISHVNRISRPNLFPLPEGKSEVKDLSDIAHDIATGFSKNYFFVEFNVPILKSEEFKLYQANSLPTFQNIFSKIITVYIKPKSRYFAISNDDNFYNMSENEFNNCNKTRFNTICNQKKQIYKTDKETSCEYFLIKENRESNFHSCDIYFKPGFSTYWFRAGPSREWIYTLYLAENITIDCQNSNQIKVTINNTGILKINTDCNAVCQNYHLYGSKFSNTLSKGIHVPNINLNIKSLISKEIQIHLSKKLIQAKYYNKIKEKSLGMLEREIIAEIEFQQNLEIYTHITVISIALIIGLCTIIIGIVLIFYWQKIKDLVD